MECVKIVSLSLICVALNVHLYGTDTVASHVHYPSASQQRKRSPWAFICFHGCAHGPFKTWRQYFFSRRGQSPRDGSRWHENLASGFGPSEDPNSELWAALDSQWISPCDTANQSPPSVHTAHCRHIERLSGVAWLTSSYRSRFLSATVNNRGTPTCRS